MKFSLPKRDRYGVVVKHTGMIIIYEACLRQARSLAPAGVIWACLPINREMF